MTNTPSPLFGTAGLPASFYEMGYKKSAQAPEYLSRFGLNAFEYQCGHGVRIGAATAVALREQAQAHHITLSLHAPYYISMASLEEEKRENSLRYFLQSAQAARALGGTRVVFHPGSIGRQTARQAFAKTRQLLARVRALLDREGYADIHLCPETMGRPSQLGSLEDVLQLCRDDARHIPCLDFGHLNARAQGAIQTQRDYAAILDAVARALPDERAARFHVHFSKIEYTAKGERRHLTFEDTTFGPPFEPFMELCASRKLAPTVICESDGTQAEDAQTMMRYYASCF